MQQRLLIVGWILLWALPGWSQSQIFTGHNGTLHFYDGPNYQRSNNSGVTWQVLPSPSGTAEVSGCQVFELNQILYAARLENQRMVLSPSYSGGENWLKPKFLDLPSKPETFKLLANQDSLHLIYQKDGRIYYMRSFDQGATFSPSKIINEHYPSETQAQLAVFGERLLSLFAFRENSKVKLYLTRSLDNGKSWNLPEPFKEEWNKIKEISLTSLTDSLLLLFINRTQQNAYELQAQAISEDQWAAPKKIFESSQKFSSLEALAGPDQALLLGFTQNSQINFLRYAADRPEAAVAEIFSGLARDRFKTVTLQDKLAGQGNLTDYLWPEAYFQNLSAKAPKLTLLKPKPLEWLKPAATFYLEAAVLDSQNDLTEDAPLKVTVNRKEITHSLVYSSEDRLVSGFVTLPSDLGAGKFNLQVSLCDQAGNAGKAALELQLDPAPPVLEASFKNGAALKNSHKLLIPLADKDAGLDLKSSVIQLRKPSSEEVKGSTVLESGKLYFIPQTALAEGDYLIEISPRDLAGNVGATQTVLVQIGGAAGGYVSSLNTNILKLEYGPNPFNPALDKEYVFKFSLASLSQVKIYIFDLQGNTLARFNLGQTSGSAEKSSLVWDGSTQFGGKISAGVYPFALWTEDAAGKQEAHRGKIIVL